MDGLLRTLLAAAALCLMTLAGPTAAAAQSEDPADRVLESMESAADDGGLMVDAAQRGTDSSLFLFEDSVSDGRYKAEIKKIPLEERKAYRETSAKLRAEYKKAKRFSKLAEWGGWVLDAAEYVFRVGRDALEGNWPEVLAETAGFVAGRAAAVVTKTLTRVACAEVGAVLGVAATPAVGVTAFAVCTGIGFVAEIYISKAVDDAVTDGLRRAGREPDPAPEVVPPKTTASGTAPQKPAPPRAPPGLDSAAASRLGGIIDLNVSTRDVNTASSGSSTAVTDIGVARGDGNAEVDVSVGGTVTTRADGKSSAITKIGVAEGGDAKINVTVDGPVTTTATGRSSARTDIGVSTGGDVNARVDSVSTTATGRSDAAATVGAASGGGRADVSVGGGVTTSASGKASASNEIGIGDGGGRANARIDGGANAIASGSGSASNRVGVANGGRANARVGGSVNAIGTGSGSASNEIGVSSGGSSSATVGGSVTSIGSGGGNASTRIGVGSSATVGGSVINKGGDLEIGASCAARRNGQCCVQIHRRLCALSVVPTHKGRCPPRYERWGGLCYLYSDKIHSIQR